MNFTEIIWDFDGTLFDTYPGMLNAFKKALEDEGIYHSKEELLKQMRVSVSDALNHYKKENNIDKNRIEENFRYYENNLFMKSFLPFPYIKEICQYIVSNGGRNFLLTHRDGLAIKLLENHEMFHLFSDCIIKEHGFKRKPAPEAFIHLIDKYNLDKSKTLGVGDRDLDIFAAQAAGINACLLDVENTTYTLPT